MYTVKMGQLYMHDLRIPELRLHDPKLSHEINKAGSFTFTIYKNHPYIGRIIKLRSIMEISDDSGVIWRGRILNTTSGFYNELSVTCEGELAFLNDSRIRTYDYEGTLSGYFTFLIKQHNDQVDADKQFKLGNITVTDPNDYLHFSSTQYPKTLDELSSKLVAKYGGYVWFRHEGDGVYIDYLKDSGFICGQTIAFGQNLLDLSQVIKGQDVYTVVVPRGAQIKAEDGSDTGKRVDITSVNDGLDYVVNEGAAAVYGRISALVTWDDVTEPANLLRKAQEYVADSGQLAASITLTAADLHDMQLDISNFRLFRYVKVTSVPHGLDDFYLIRKIDINLSNPADGKLSVGTSFKTLTDKQVESDNSLGSIVERVEHTESNIKINADATEEVKKSTIYSVSVLYALGTSSETPPITGWSSKAPSWTSGYYMWQKTVTTYGDGTVKTSDPVCISGAEGQQGEAGEDATVLRIDSSRGTVFKNSDIGTVMTVTIHHGGECITDTAGLHRVFGAAAYLEWKWKRLNDAHFGTISADDSRITDGGFTFTIGPGDVDTKTVFMCALNV